MRDPAGVRAAVAIASLLGAAPFAAACQGRRAADRAPPGDPVPAEAEDPDAPRVIGGGPPTVWAVHCRDALTNGRAAAAAIEPVLATMPLTLQTRPDREQLTASAYPPVWQVAPIHVFVSRPATGAAPSTSEWQTFAHSGLGSDHRVARRTRGGVEAAIMLDDWDPTRADQVIAAFTAALGPCFPRNAR